ncbi:MAG: BatA domain-containing protein [Calditrichia bacterium]
MFNFLNPSILFALAAGLIPLLIHLLNRRRMKEIEFSTIHFLKQMARKEMRRLRIRQILLLIIRTLIILLLVLVFARPTLRTSPGLITGRSASEVVVIIDNSLSLNSLQLTGNLLEKVRQRWREIEAAFQSGDRISVILGVKPLKVLREREPYGTSLWDQIAKEIQPGYLTGDLPSAFLKALEIYRKSDLYNQELYVISDFQKSSEGFSQLENWGEVAPERMKIFCLPVFHTEEENLSVDSASIKNQLVEKNLSVQINAFIKNHYAKKHLNSMVSLVLENNRVAQQNTSVAPEEQKGLQFETTLRSSGFITGYAECESDVLLEDNRYFFNFFVPEHVRVLHLSGIPQTESFIPLILKPGIEKALFDYEYKNLRDWATADFFQYEMIILEGADQIPVGLENRLSQYSRRGNGLLIIPGDQVVPASFNKLLTPLGLGSVIERRGDPAVSEEFVTIGDVVWNHPIFEGLFEKRKELNPIYFYAYYHLKPFPGNEQIIRLKNNSPLLISSGKKEAGVFLLAAPLQGGWTNLSLRGFVVPLLYRLIYYAATRMVRERLQISVGERFSEIFRVSPGITQFTLRRPNGVEEKISPTYKGSELLLQIEENDIPGNYQIWQGDKPFAVYSVNHSSAESIQQYYTADELEAHLGHIEWLPDEGQILQRIETSRFGVELWPYLLGIALFLLLVEMLLAYTGSRKESQQWEQELARG